MVTHRVYPMTYNYLQRDLLGVQIAMIWSIWFGKTKVAVYTCLIHMKPGNGPDHSYLDTIRDLWRTILRTVILTNQLFLLNLVERNFSQICSLFGRIFIFDVHCQSSLESWKFVIRIGRIVIGWYYSVPCCVYSFSKIRHVIPELNL